MTEVELADSWRAAVGDREVCSGLEEIYADTAAAISERGPACWASGRCCNFEKAGHRLYVTGLETAYCVSKLRGVWGPVIEMPKADDRAKSVSRLPILQADSEARVNTHVHDLAGALADAVSRGGCPFQYGNVCGVHAIKPLGCRVYFCDRSAQGWQQELSETMLLRIRELHDQHSVEYRYGEWRTMLDKLVR